MKNFIGQRFLSLGMILAIAFLLLVSLAVSAALSAFGTFLSGFLPAGFSAPVLRAIGFIASLVIVAALFAAMFKVLPDVQIHWHDVWIGASITAILFTIGKFLGRSVFWCDPAEARGCENQHGRDDRTTTTGLIDYRRKR